MGDGLAVRRLTQRLTCAHPTSADAIDGLTGFDALGSNRLDQGISLL